MNKLFFRHVGQCLHLSVCPITGIVGTVGIDGRLVESISGRLAPHGQMEDFACSNYRPTMQLIRRNKTTKQSISKLMDAVDKQKDKEKENIGKPFISHDDVVENCWLEIRFGDSALIEQKKIICSDARVEKATYNRRLEMLTRIEFSQFSGGLAICGGEAGLVFILPTSL